MKAAAHLAKSLGIETLRITTFDDAYYAVLDAFKKKGNTKILDEKKFYSYVGKYLPEEYQDRKDIIDAVYKSAKKAYNEQI